MGVSEFIDFKDELPSTHASEFLQAGSRYGIYLPRKIKRRFCFIPACELPTEKEPIQLYSRHIDVQILQTKHCVGVHIERVTVLH